MLAQLLINALGAAATLLLVAAAFSVIYSATTVFHFGVGAAYVTGAYGAWFAATRLRWPAIPSIMAGIMLAGVLGWIMVRGIFLPFRRRGSSSLTQMLASMGFYIVVQELVALLAGDASRSLLPGNTPSIHTWGTIRVTSIQLATMIVAALIVFLLWRAMHTSRIGLAFRAVASDPELATISGINSDHVAVWSFIVGSMLAAVAGIMTGLDTLIVPVMGLHAMLLGVVVTLIGGTGVMKGLIAASFMVAILKQFGVLVMSSQWLEVLVFMALITVLMIRPGGLLAMRLRRD